MTYLRDAWYVAAMYDELQPGTLLARTYLGEPVVLFRDAGGAPRALADRCPHRFVPLSQGVLREGGAALQCRYHGLQFDAGGACVHNPQGPVPARTRVRSYPTCERHRLIWIWPGDPEHADVSLIPDYSNVTSAPEHGTIRGYLPTACNYELLVDNILDLSHVDFLHPTSLGSGALSKTKPEVTTPSDRSLKISWVSSGDIAPPAFDRHLRLQGQPTDQWTDVTWTAPSTMLLRVGATLQGEPREAGANSANLHLATPETATTMHYWYWSTREFAVSAEENVVLKQVVEGIFRGEDKPMLELQQQRVGEADLWSLRPLVLPCDTGAVRVRRKLQALISAELQEKGSRD